MKLKLENNELKAEVKDLREDLDNSLVWELNNSAMLEEAMLISIAEEEDFFDFCYFLKKYFKFNTKQEKYLEDFYNSSASYLRSRLEDLKGEEAC